MNMKLWEIDDAIRSCVDFETGEIIDPIYLDQLEMLRDQKIEGVALYCKELAYFAGEIAKEIETLTARKKAAENAVKGMKAWLAEACSAKKFETPRCKVSFRTTESTIIDNEDAVPMDYKTEQISYSISKTEIKEAIKSGVTVPGAHLQSNISTIIK